MKIVTKCNGVKAEHDLRSQPLTALIYQSGVKVEAPSAYTISPSMTIQCMRDMTQQAWEFISTGPLFKHFFSMLFGDSVVLPLDVSSLCEDYDNGVIHGCGLIILLVEAMFEGRRDVYLDLPETYLPVHQVRNLVTVILEIQRLSGGLGASSISSSLQSPL